jgi:mannan endo-1,4-beta-mannosidase
MRNVTILHDHFFSRLSLLGMILLFIIFNACVSIGFGLSSPHSLGFISARGQELFLNDHLFHFVGVNRYNLLSNSNNDRSCGESWTHQELDHYFAEMQQLSITAIRFWAFQHFTHGTDFSTFDYIITLSEKYNIKLIPTLENQHSDCTEGGYKYASWYRNGYLTPYGSYCLSFKNYVSRIVSRYKNSQEIMMWQIMNEAESKDTNNKQDFQALYSFAKDISFYMKSLDPNHLISLGTVGSGLPGTQGDDYRRLHALQTINVLEYHDYNSDTSPLPPNLSQRFVDSRVLNKPLFVGEAGIKSQCAGSGCYTPKQRADLFRAKMSAFFREGGAGYLIWSYRDNHYNPGQVYEFDAKDPLAQVVRNFAMEVPDDRGNPFNRTL